MASLSSQISALCRKNLIVLWQHRILNIFRCLIIPIYYATYLVQTKTFYDDQGIRGPGSVSAMRTLPSDLNGLKLVYVDATSAFDPGADTQSAGTDLLASALTHAGVGVSPIRVATPEDVPQNCPGGLNSVTECFAAFMFDHVDTQTGTLNYTLRGDFGLNRINVEDAGKDDYQKRFLPLQWAIESTFINLTTGTLPDTPQTWAYTNITKNEYNDEYTRDFVKEIRGVNIVSYVIALVWVVYHLVGALAAERCSRLTEHLETMGCRTSARYISWFLSMTAFHAPGWIAAGGIWGAQIWKHINMGLIIGSLIIMGLSIVSWTFLLATPFGRAPTIAAIFATAVFIGSGLVGFAVGSNAAVQIVLVILLPPTFIVSAMWNWSSWEMAGRSLSMIKKSPDGDAPMVALLIMAIVNIFIYPFIAAYAERLFHGVPPTHGKKQVLPPATAVELRNVNKTYTSRRFVLFGKKKSTLAIEDLSFDVPRGEIFCLLGRNGSAKSTTLGAIAQLIPITSGSVKYASDLRVGFASQKDVLWDELTCAQHVRLWRGIKDSDQVDKEGDAELLERCNLTPKAGFLAKKISGGQKRKLQLACALAGGSNLLLLDEITSGLDPLSRRAIWEVVSAHRGLATIVLTTHFLDEADYLADNIAILQAPGKLLALDTPVALKTQLGHGFTVSVDNDARIDPDRLLDILREDEPNLSIHSTKGKHLFYTGSNDMTLVRRLVRRLQTLRRGGTDIRYQVGSTTLEEVFLDLNTEDDTDAPQDASSITPLQGGGTDTPRTAVTSNSKFPFLSKFTSMSKTPSDTTMYYAENELEAGFPVHPSSQLYLSPGAQLPWWRRDASMVWTIVVKRILIFTRGWLLPIGCALAVILATTIPLVFMKGRVQTCDYAAETEIIRPMTYPFSQFRIDFEPPLIAVGDSGVANWTSAAVDNAQMVDTDAFQDTLKSQMANMSLGALSLAALPASSAIVAWEDAKLEAKGVTMLNMYSNSLLAQLRPDAEPFRIRTNWQFIPSPDFRSTGKVLIWFTFFGFVMGIWPAFAAVYPTQEKASNVRANQYSNGAKPVALWLGHLVFELPFILIVSSVMTIGFAASGQFNGLGNLWVCLVFFGITSTLWAFVFSLMVKSALGAWALVAVYNAVTFIVVYLVYMFINILDKGTKVTEKLNIAQLGIGVIGPVPNIARAALVSVNSFNLLCDGFGQRTTKPFSNIHQFGGPIAYLAAQAFFAFGILIYVDSGAPIPFRRFFRRARPHAVADDSVEPDVIREKERVEDNATDSLVVKDLMKKYDRKSRPAVEDVSFGVNVGETFALIGPNGAGKTTMLACIRGVEWPTRGDVSVMGRSIVKSRNKARSELGVCPQVNAIDDNLTVGQHLWLYGRLKGVPKRELARDVAVLLSISGLAPKADDLATSLSGGNQRKLALAIALIGDRPVILIDEFSSGVDPFSKREAWATLATLTRERAVVMTTHSMEEVDALASRVGIIATKMLAIGTPSTLKSRFATYEVHLSSANVDPAVEYLRKRGFPLARRSLDTQTRLAVPGVGEDDLDSLLGVLQGAAQELGLEEMTLHEASTENAFLSIVREHNVKEDNAADDDDKPKKKHWWQRKKKTQQEQPHEEQPQPQPRGEDAV